MSLSNPNHSQMWQGIKPGLVTAMSHCNQMVLSLVVAMGFSQAPQEETAGQDAGKKVRD